MSAALILARRFWPILLALSVLAAVVLWGNHREHQGTITERTKWQAVAAAQALQAAQDIARQQAAINAANTAATAARASLAALARRSKDTAHVYYKDRPVVRCLDPERLRAIAEADTAATAAITPQ
jgi:hypothetical protein